MSGAAGSPDGVPIVGHKDQDRFARKRFLIHPLHESAHIGIQGTDHGIVAFLFLG